ncbi:MAG: hypothetical protein ABIE03_07115 [Patescibacteria group bacterium]|nr:hypothetical protein [Patescibacteria group bacterium]
MEIQEEILPFPEAFARRCRVEMNLAEQVATRKDLSPQNFFSLFKALRTEMASRVRGKLDIDGSDQAEVDFLNRVLSSEGVPASELQEYCRAKGDEAFAEQKRWAIIVHSNLEQAGEPVRAEAEAQEQINIGAKRRILWDLMALKFGRKQ